MQQPPLRKLDMILDRWHKSDVIETQLNSQHDTPTINLGGEPLDFICIPGAPVVVLSHRDMSGSLTHEEFTTLNFTNLGPRGHQPDIIIWDEAHQFDRQLKAHLGPDFVFSDNCRPYYEETLRESEMFNQKMFMDIPTKCVNWQLPAHKPGETPRGTKPAYIGGTKKTKQQRAAIKARRKQR